MRFGTAIALGCLLLVAGCGEARSSDSGAKMSACSEVWLEDAQLPRNYDGCTEGTRVVRPEILDCNNHGGRWTRYHQLAAELGGKIVRLPGTPDTESRQSSYFFHC